MMVSMNSVLPPAGGHGSQIGTTVPAELDAVLELSDGSAYRGISFGAEGKSVAGECVFQTGWFF
jgi:hypothetical protein